MTPEQLRSWQPQARDAQLAEFIAQNRTLLLLLEEAWQKFAATQSDNQQAPTVPITTTAYASGYSVDQLAHFALTPEETAAFSAHFERNDRPFGNKPVITDHDWDILE